MAIVIGEIITETVVAPKGDQAQAAAQESSEQLDLVVRRATERVLETLRREWDL